MFSFYLSDVSYSQRGNNRQIFTDLSRKMIIIIRTYPWVNTQSVFWPENNLCCIFIFSINPILLMRSTSKNSFEDRIFIVGWNIFCNFLSNNNGLQRKVFWRIWILIEGSVTIFDHLCINLQKVTPNSKWTKLWL